MKIFVKFAKNCTQSIVYQYFCDFLIDNDIIENVIINSLENLLVNVNINQFLIAVDIHIFKNNLNIPFNISSVDECQGSTIKKQPLKTMPKAFGHCPNSFCTLRHQHLLDPHFPLSKLLCILVSLKYS